MRRTLPFLSSLLLLSLTACMVQPALNVPPTMRNAAQINQRRSLSLNQANASLPQVNLSPALRQELNQKPLQDFDEKTPYSEELVRSTLGTYYIKSHSYYFNMPDAGLNGDSTVVAILKHDGHTQAANLVLHWQQELSAAAVWPDSESTTYRGPWPALEHAELRRGDGWFWFKSASAKADEYYQRALDAWKKELPPNHPQQAEAWSWLGRATHFLHDVTVPFHTVSLLRPAQLIYHTKYEKSCDAEFSKYLPSKNHNPFNVWDGAGPYPQGQKPWGLYFSSSTSAADMVRFNADQARAFYTTVNEADNPQRGNWEKSRAVLLPLGAKTTAGMITSFLNTVTQ